MSVADIFRTNGILLRKTSRDRIDGWAATKEWLHPYKDEQGIMTARLRIHESCVNLIRCLPALQYDPNRPSDAATKPHEITHMPDALRSFCVYRSRGNRERPEQSYEDRLTDREISAFNSNDMFNVYGVKNDDYPNGNSSYNPMYL